MASESDAVPSKVFILFFFFYYYSRTQVAMKKRGNGGGSRTRLVKMVEIAEIIVHAACTGKRIEIL